MMFVGENELRRAEQLDTLESIIVAHLVNPEGDLAAYELLRDTAYSHGLSSSRIMSVVSQLQRCGRTKSGLYKSLIMLEESIHRMTQRPPENLTIQPEPSSEDESDSRELPPQDMAALVFKRGTLSHKILTVMLDGAPRTEGELIVDVDAQFGVSVKKHNIKATLKKCKTFVTADGGRVVSFAEGPRLAYRYIVAD